MDVSGQNFLKYDYNLNVKEKNLNQRQNIFPIDQIKFGKIYSLDKLKIYAINNFSLLHTIKIKKIKNYFTKYPKKFLPY